MIPGSIAFPIHKPLRYAAQLILVSDFRQLWFVAQAIALHGGPCLVVQGESVKGYHCLHAVTNLVQLQVSAATVKNAEV